MKFYKYLIILILSCFGFVAGLWQLEIADNFLLNDWGDYNVFFTLIRTDNIWLVRDFWMFFCGFWFLVGLLVAFRIGQEFGFVELVDRV